MGKKFLILFIVFFSIIPVVSYSFQFVGNVFIPLSSSYSWNVEGDKSFANMGYSVSSAGDVNGDGYSDVLIGCPGYDNGYLFEGCVFLYYGSSSGLSITYQWMKSGGQAQTRYGTTVACIGDVNKDGYSDIAVGTPYWDGASGNDCGKVSVYLGSATGVSDTAVWTYEGDDGDGMGYSIAGGDLNNDGFSDIVFSGIYVYDYSGTYRTGAVYVYYGDSTGIGSSFFACYGKQDLEEFGSSISVADIDANGYMELIVGAPYYDSTYENQGRVAIYRNLSNVYESIKGTQYGEEFGYSVFANGDINGDGYDDIVVGSPGYDNTSTDNGRLYVYYGNDTFYFDNADVIIECTSDSALFGKSVCMGDFDEDGYADVMVGSPFYMDNTGVKVGAAFVYRGEETGLETTYEWRQLGTQNNEQFGYSVSYVGDVNGDGFGDIIVGSPYYDNANGDAGRVFVYYGGKDGFSSEPDAMWYPKETDGSYGGEVKHIGDVNGDGYGDICIGAPYWDGGETDEGAIFVYYGSSDGIDADAYAYDFMAESNDVEGLFGYSIGYVGDMNGDGYDDMIVGEPGYDGYRGKAVLYRGDSTGIIPTAWYGVGDVGTKEQYGFSVSGCGDIDNDGYNDFMVSSPYYINGSGAVGKVTVYYGREGILPAVVQTFYGYTDGDEFGYSISYAGDVNGDGYDDIVIGAPGTIVDGVDNTGMIMVMFGDSSGLDSLNSYIDYGNSSAGGERFGYSVCHAGDVNGDGYSDIIVGAPYHSEAGMTNGGMVRLYYMGEYGVLSTWENVYFSDNAFLGWDVSSGNFNGDEYSDIVVSAKGVNNYRGAIHVYYGNSGTSLNSSPDWAYAYSGADSTEFGYSISGIGDINGDGYDDIIVGAPRYVDYIAENGMVAIFYGNGKHGLDIDAQQKSYSHNISPGLYSDIDGGICLYAKLQDFRSVDKMRIIWEIKPVGSAFDGTNLYYGDWKFGNSLGFLDTITGLTSNGRYKWRFRIEYGKTKGSVKVYSKWFYPLDNGPGEEDFVAKSYFYMPFDTITRYENNKEILHNIYSLIKISDLNKIIKERNIKIYDINGRMVNEIKAEGTYYIVYEDGYKVKVEVVK